MDNSADGHEVTLDNNNYTTLKYIKIQYSGCCKFLFHFYS